MINRKHRFHGYGSLRFVYRGGATARGPLFAVKCLPNTKRNEYRLAVVVSRKVSKSAVSRNKIRRRLYEAVRNLEKEIAAPYDIVITVFHETISDISNKELENQVKKQLKMAGIIKTKTTP